MYDEYLKANPKKEAGTLAPSLVGAKVTVHSLEAAKAYNGLEGTGVGLVGERYTVDLGAKQLNVKRANFRVHCSYPQCTKNERCDECVREVPVQLVLLQTVPGRALAGSQARVRREKARIKALLFAPF